MSQNNYEVLCFQDTSPKCRHTKSDGSVTHRSGRDFTNGLNKRMLWVFQELMNLANKPGARQVTGMMGFVKHITGNLIK